MYWGKKEDAKKVIPFTVMTTMIFVGDAAGVCGERVLCFEDWDLGIVSERKEKLDDTDDAIKKAERMAETGCIVQ